MTGARGSIGPPEHAARESIVAFLSCALAEPS